VNLLLNITPDGHGEIPEAQIRRLKEFGDEINSRFSKPLAATKGEGKALDLKTAGCYERGSPAATRGHQQR